MHESDLTKFLEPLSCQSTSEEISCKNSSITEDQIKQFKVAQNKYVKEILQQSEKQVNESIDRSREFQSKPIILRKNLVNKPQETEFFNKPAFTRKEESNEINKEESKPKPGFFKTASDELHYQNLKKYGKNNGGNSSSEGNYNYGVVKKSLGARRGGINSKFQPPIKNKEEM